MGHNPTATHGERKVFLPDDVQKHWLVQQQWVSTKATTTPPYCSQLTVVNIITDFLFASLPIPLVFQLQVNLRTKMTLVSILSLGFFASAAAIVKCIKQWNVLTDLDWTVYGHP